MIAERLIGCFIMATMPKEGVEEALKVLRDIYEFSRTLPAAVPSPSRRRVSGKVAAKYTRPELVIPEDVSRADGGSPMALDLKGLGGPASILARGKCPRCGAPHDTLAGVEAQNTALRESLLEMTGDVEWMSGSPDFAPGEYDTNVPAGQAHEGWLRVQIRLARARKLLEKKP